MQGGNRSRDKPQQGFREFSNSQLAPSGNNPSSCYRDDCKIERVFVQLKPGLSEQEKQVVVNAIRSNLDSDLQFVFDTLQVRLLLIAFIAFDCLLLRVSLNLDGYPLCQAQADANMANNFLQLFLNVIAAIAFTLCFFVTSVTVLANIRESVREIGGT